MKSRLTNRLVASDHFQKLSRAQEGKKGTVAVAASVMVCACRIVNSSDGVTARLSIAYCPLHRAAPELVSALKAVTPPHRSKGRCWCSVGHDIDLYGHEGSCQMAQRALYKACEFTARTTPSTSPVEPVTNKKGDS